MGARFLTRAASDEPLADQVRTFCETLERESRWEDWQIQQAEHALRIYFVHFLKRTDWQKKPASSVVDERGHTSPLVALEQLRHRLRTRHYSYRTECSYIDWVRRFFAYLTESRSAAIAIACVSTPSSGKRSMRRRIPSPLHVVGALVRRPRRTEARPLVDLSDFQSAELSDFGPALTIVRFHLSAGPRPPLCLMTHDRIGEDVIRLTDVPA